MSVSGVIKSIQDIMRKDAGVDGDALLKFLNNDLFQTLKNLSLDTGTIVAAGYNLDRKNPHDAGAEYKKLPVSVGETREALKQELAEALERCAEATGGPS